MANKCSKCGTEDCESLEEYQRQISVSGAGVLHVRSSVILKSCAARTQLKILQEMIDDKLIRINC